MLALAAAPGAPGGIELREVDEPRLGPGVAVVEVRASSLNRGECSALRTAEDGWRPGWDVSGVIAGAAPDGSSPPNGTRVVGWANGGGWAERVAVRSDHLAPIPKEMGFEVAATLPVAGLTAVGTLELGGPLAGKRVAITGAAGGVGRFAVQLAHAAGANVTAVVGSPERGLGLPELGTDEVVIGLDPEGAAFDLLIESDDLVVSNWTVRGTHTGTPFYGVGASVSPLLGWRQFLLLLMVALVGGSWGLGGVIAVGVDADLDDLAIRCFSRECSRRRDPLLVCHPCDSGAHRGAHRDG